MNKRILLCLLLVCLAFVWTACGDDDNISNSTNTRPEGLLYVLNQADTTIYIYDTKTFERLAVIDAEVEEPHFIEFSNDGDYYYVISRKTGGSIAKFRTIDNSLVVIMTSHPTHFPTALAIDANDFCYITDFTLAQGAIRKYDVSGENFTIVTGSLNAGFQTHDIRISDDKKYLVAAGYGSDDLVIYDTETEDFTFLTLDSARLEFNPASNDYGPYGIAIDHLGRTAYIACRKGTDQIRIIDLVNRTIIDSILVPVSNNIDPNKNGPTYMDISNDNNTLYVTNYLENTVSVIQISTREVIKTIEFSTPKPFSVILNDAGTHLYVSCTNTRPELGMIYVIETESHTKVDSLVVGSEPFGFAWRPTP